MKIDFHCHSSYSDGTYTPEQLIRRASERGVEALAITDHDTLAGYRKLKASPGDVALIPGIELSCQWQGKCLHIVGLNIEPESPSMLLAEQTQCEARFQRAQIIANKLSDYGLITALSGTQKIAGENAIGKPHFARYMTESGFVRSEKDAFKKFLGAGKPCDTPACWPELAQVIQWILDARGVAVLAHPLKYQLSRKRLGILLEEFKSCGGQGLEVVSGRQLPAETQYLATLSRQFSLYASWGSDYHGGHQTWLDIGGYSTPPRDIEPVWNLWQ